MTPTDLISAAEAAELLNTPVNTFNRWVAAGRITPAHVMPGRTGARLYSRAEIARIASGPASERAS